MFEDRIAAIEGAEDAFATASGMAAVNGALMALVKAGDHVVAARALFGSCLYILETVLPACGVEVTLIDGADRAAWEAAVNERTRLCFFESLSNPALELVDIEAVCEIAHAKGALVVCDNVFATPVYSKCVSQGVDIVIYSATKHIDGQGRALGGVILGPEALIRGPVEAYMKHTGGAMSPFNAWIMLKGLETMDLRVRAQTANAERITQALRDHPKLRRVIYPGDSSHPQHALAQAQMGAGGTMLAFDLAGGKEAAFRFLDALDLAVISNNLGDAKTIATPPAFTTHQRLPDAQKAVLGITPGLIRLSCGIEDPEDLVADILQALDAV
jgi:O-succinylhomoserine sulfhydrylase